MAGHRVLFDVGPIALAHAETPVSDVALEYVRAAVHGTLEAIVPYTGVLGAHYVLRNVYSMAKGEASTRLQNFLEASDGSWYGRLGTTESRSALRWAAEYNVDAWDGYYVHVAHETNVDTLLTLDYDFENIDGFEAQVILSDDQFARLTRFMER